MQTFLYKIQKTESRNSYQKVPKSTKDCTRCGCLALSAGLRSVSAYQSGSEDPKG